MFIKINGKVIMFDLIGFLYCDVICFSEFVNVWFSVFENGYVVS